jgi:glucokinase
MNLGIDFGGLTIKVGGDDGSTPQRIPATGEYADLASVENAVVALIAGRADSVIESVAIAVPGIVDRQRNALVFAPEKYRDLVGFDLRQWAQTAFSPKHTVVENDARAALWGEVHGGIADGETDAVIVVLGTGIGTAAICGGELVRGAHEHAGILGGHFTVELDGPQCPCGNIGCAEAVASTWALQRDLAHSSEATRSPFWLEALEQGRVGLRDLFRTDDTFASITKARYIRTWGSLIVNLCHAYDPSTVILSGGVAESTTLMPQLREYVNNHLWLSAHRPQFLVSEDPGNSVLRGLWALGQNRQSQTEDTR